MRDPLTAKQCPQCKGAKTVWKEFDPCYGAKGGRIQCPYCWGRGIVYNLLQQPRPESEGKNDE